MTRRALVHALFAASGAAGLIYQVAWVRAFGLVFGSSVPSASLVTATFLAGLGLGGWLAGAWADRHPRRLLRGWAALELGIAALGTAVTLGLPQLLPVSAAVSSYAPTAEGWAALTWGSHLARVGIAAVTILPSAMAMGATLPLLVRHEAGSTEGAGRAVASLMAANTAGAAMGALLTDTLLVQTLGVAGAQQLAVAINVGLAASAWKRARPEDPTPREAPPEQPWAPWRLQGALFLAGACAMGLELVWFRFLAGALGPYRAVFSVLLALMLLAQALGAAAAGQWLRYRLRADRGLALTQALVVTAALGGLWAFDPYTVLERQHAVVEAYRAAGPWGQAWLLHGVNARTIAGLMGLSALAMGATFPLANALAQGDPSRVGRRVGGLYLATTSGNVVGALATGFLALPGLGMQSTTLLLATAGLLAGALVVRDRASSVALAPGVVALAAFATLPADTVLWASFPHGRAQQEPLLEVREGLEQVLVVTGEPGGPARLWTSGHPMTSTTPHAQRYMRAMAHVPLLLRDAPRDALVICVGAGNTVHAASLHPTIERVDAVDLSADVLAVLPHFAHAHGGVLHDEAVHAYVNDGRHHLLMQPPATYDLITLEPPPLAAAGVSSLYSRDLYALAADRLRPDGILSQWLPAYQVPEDDVRSLVRSFVEVFPHAVLLQGSGRELILLGSRAPLSWDPTSLGARLASRPEVHADLLRLDLGDAHELASLFAADRDTLVAATTTSEPVTDDRPRLEAAQVSHLMETALPADLFAPRRLASWCGPCATDPDLAEVVRITEALFASEPFLHYSAAVPTPTATLPPPDLSDRTLDAIARSPTLRRTLRAPDALALRAQELWSRGDTDSALRTLEAARTQAPGVPLLDELHATWSTELAQ